MLLCVLISINFECQIQNTFFPVKVLKKPKAIPKPLVASSKQTAPIVPVAQFEAFKVYEDLKDGDDDTKEKQHAKSKYIHEQLEEKVEVEGKQNHKADVKSQNQRIVICKQQKVF